VNSGVTWAYTPDSNPRGPRSRAPSALDRAHVAHHEEFPMKKLGFIAMIAAASMFELFSTPKTNRYFTRKTNRPGKDVDQFEKRIRTENAH
jgi:hypothetical protein